MNAEIVTDSLTPDQTPESRNLGQVVATLSRRLSPDVIGGGDVAALRHMAADDLPPAFWKSYLTDVPAILREPGGCVDERIDRAWAALVCAMVEMPPNSHSFKHPFGAALADTGYAEGRFVRFLRAEGAGLAREVRVAGAWLAHKGTRFTNWEQPAHLLLRDAGLKVKVWPVRVVRHQMARDYFRTAARKSSNQ